MGIVCGVRGGAGWRKAWAMVTAVLLRSDFLQIANLGVISPMMRRELRTESIHPDFRVKERQGCGSGLPGLPQVTEER